MALSHNDHRIFGEFMLERTKTAFSKQHYFLANKLKM